MQSQAQTTSVEHPTLAPIVLPTDHICCVCGAQMVLEYDNTVHELLEWCPQTETHRGRADQVAEVAAA